MPHPMFSEPIHNARRIRGWLLTSAALAVIGLIPGASAAQGCDCEQSTLYGDSVQFQFQSWAASRVTATAGPGAEHVDLGLPNAPRLRRWNIDYRPNSIRIEFVVPPGTGAASYGNGAYMQFLSLNPRAPAGCSGAPRISAVRVTTNRPSSPWAFAASFTGDSVRVPIAPPSGIVNWTPGQWIEAHLTYQCPVVEHPRPTRLCALKYHDRNGNGRRDPGEAALSGWTFEFSGRGLNARARTDREGLACVDRDVRPGTYRVRENPILSGWRNTDPGGANPVKSATVQANQTTIVEFGNCNEARDRGCRHEPDRFDVSVAKTGPDRAGRYTIQVTNAGRTLAAGAIIRLRDIVPAGMTVTGVPGAPWQCDAQAPMTGPDALTCILVAPAVIPPGTALPPVTIAARGTGACPNCVRVDVFENRAAYDIGFRLPEGDTANNSSCAGTPARP